MDFPIYVSGLDSEGVTLISPTTQGFDGLARPMLGRLADLALKLKPYLVVVSNQSPQTVVALTSEWRLRTRRGATITYRSQSKYPDAVCGNGLARRNERGIPPGGKQVIGRGCAVEPESDDGDGAWLEEFVHDKERELADATELHIELDAVIFEDGTLIGPDASGLAKHFEIYVKAKQEIYRTLAKRLKECNASEDFFEPVRAMLLNPKDLGLPALRDPNVLWPSQAAAEVISWQRRTLLEPLKMVRTEPFVIRRRSESEGE